MKKFISTIIFVFVVQTSFSSEEINFNIWLGNFKSEALKKGISQDTINKTFTKVRYVERVIEYDRKQPEFFEDTNTYIKKRATRSKVIKARKFYFKNKTLFDEVEKKFKVEKELLLSLWGIETNFGKNVGKMDIISSLATLSFDKRRSKFFSNQLMSLLELIDDNLIKIDTLYGSWAGAFGNFQFMPSTIKNYAIDYDKNSKIELKKSLYDSVASAANYVNKVGWKFGTKCFYQVKLMKPVKKKYINDSAKNIKNYLSINKWKEKGIANIDNLKIKTNVKAALILPDGTENSPAYLVFDNYEKILKWNRSLRFGITVCTLANMIKDEI